MKQKVLTAHIVIVALAVLIGSCSKSTQYEIYLNDAAEQIESNPEQSMESLKHVTDHVDMLPENLRMRYYLLLADAQNKLYEQMPSDSLFNEVVSYYDNHGNANEQMKAHYLLGCIYRDMNEAPMALSCYNEATSLADTLSSSCDFYSLAGVYGQIAEVYDLQNMPYEEIEALENCRRCSEKTGDTYTAIQCIQLLVRPYNILRDTAKILECSERSYTMFMKNHLETAAVRTLPSRIDIYVARQQFDKAAELMHEYETKSGYFNSEGQPIRRNLDYYYYNKGCYYEWIGMNDSARICYEHLLHHGFMYDGCKKLIGLYSQANNVDSIKKYSKLLVFAFDDYQSTLHVESIRQIAGMYDYTRNQNIAAKQAVEIQRNRLTITVISLISLTIIAVIILISIYKKRKKRQEYARIAVLYTSQLMQIGKLEHELELAENNHQKYVEHKTQEIDEVKRSLQQIEEHVTNSRTQVNILESSQIVEKLHASARHPFQGNITHSDWDELSSMALKIHPSLHFKLTQFYTTSSDEYKTAMLIYLGFKVSEISILMNKMPNRITNIKSDINLRLFNSKTARTLIFNLRKLDFIG